MHEHPSHQIAQLNNLETDAGTPWGLHGARVGGDDLAGVTKHWQAPMWPDIGKHVAMCVLLMSQRFQCFRLLRKHVHWSAVCPFPV